MAEDPIVAEVRRAGRQLEEQAGGDLHTFFEHLRKTQDQYRDRLVHDVRKAAVAAESSLQRSLS